MNSQRKLQAFGVLSGFILTGVLVIYYSISKEAIQKTNQKLIKFKKLDQTKTEFISIASHQLRSFLSVIRWGVEMLLRGYLGEINARQRKVLNTINTVNERLTQLINESLNLSRIETKRLEFRFKPVNLSIFEKGIKKLIDVFKIEASKKNISLKGEFSLDLTKFVELDLEKIIEVVQNLLENAIAYTPPSGQIVIKIENNKTDLVFHISDSGIGIPLKEQSKIFLNISSSCTF
jgi:signal transduction histidine kinase